MLRVKSFYATSGEELAKQIEEFLNTEGIQAEQIVRLDFQKGGFLDWSTNAFLTYQEVQ